MKSNHMSVINNLILKNLHKFPAELSHNITIKLLKYGITPNYKINSDINTKINNLIFNHPTGIVQVLIKMQKHFLTFIK